MARTTATFIPNVSASATTSTLSLDDIPEDVRTEVEEIYAALKSAPDGRMRVQFDTVDELRQYQRWATAYCAMRPDGAIRFRKSPTRGLPETVIDFRITDLLTENEEKTADVRAATVAAGGADGTPKTQRAAVVAAGKAPAKAATPVKMPAKRR